MTTDDVSVELNPVRVDEHVDPHKAKRFTLSVTGDAGLDAAVRALLKRAAQVVKSTGL